MSDNASSARGIGIKTFLLAWCLITFISIIGISFTFQSLPAARSIYIDLLLIFFPNVIPAIGVGLFLGPKLSSDGYIRSMLWQSISAIIWAILFAIWLFILLFRHEFYQVITGNQTFHSLLKIFSLRAIEIVCTSCLFLAPITFISSGITLFFMRRQSSPA